ncbi:MAG: hypothetical protein JXL81_04055 [Deltaproteobacteria bacterium]|nr:hypothetical protein [Deltaproteobacteria bacterium]
MSNVKKTLNSTRMTGLDQFLWNLTNDQDLFCIWAIARVEEPLKDNLIKKSLEYLIKIVPILNSKPVTNWLSGKWQFIEKTNVEDLVTRINVKTDEEAIERLHNVFLNPIDACGFSKIRVISIDSPHKHFFIIQVHHLAVDGEGLKRICVKFAEIYQELYNNPEWKPVQILDPCRSWQQIAKKISWLHLFLIPKSYIINLFKMIVLAASRDRVRYKIIGDVKSDDMKDVLKPPYFEDITIEKKTMLELKEFTKRQHCTVNDVLITSFSLATMKWNQGRGDNLNKLRFGYTANIRRWWGEPAGTFGNFSGILMHDEISRNLQKSSDALSSTIKKMNKVKKTVGLDGFITLLQIKLIPYCIIRRLALRLKKKAFDYVRRIHAMTNIGIIYKEAGNFGHTSAIEYSIIAPALSGGTIIYTITTYKDKTTIYLGASEDYLTKTSAKSFLKLWKQMILEGISTEKG